MFLAVLGFSIHMVWTDFMTTALTLAGEAKNNGDIPIGALLTDGEKIIASGYNRREKDQSPTAHAEIIAIEQAARERGNWHLDGLSLVVTVEPCAMCAGASVLARLDRIVFGTPNTKAGAVRSLYRIADDSRLNHRCEIVEGVLQEQCQEMMSSFFREKRLEQTRLKQNLPKP